MVKRDYLLSDGLRFRLELDYSLYLVTIYLFAVYKRVMSIYYSIE